MVERLVDGSLHVSGLRQADQLAVSRTDGDFRFVAVLLDCEDHLGFKLVAQNSADFREARFYLFADGGGNFVVPAGVFHVHERPSSIRSQANWAVHFKEASPTRDY